MVKRWSRSTSDFCILIGQNLTGEFMPKIYAASWKLFTLTAEADRVLCKLVTLLTVFFHWMYKMKHSYYQESGGVRHDPQRFMPHFNRDTVEFASRMRNESNAGIKTLLPFPKNITEESDFENFQDLIVALDACYWLHKTISKSLSRFGDERAI